MTEKSCLMGDINSAENELSALYQLVYVVTVTYSEHIILLSGILLFLRRGKSRFFFSALVGLSEKQLQHYGRYYA